MFRCTNPLLRRPFSFHKIDKKGFELLYKVVGKGTKILSERKKGKTLSVLGPLGNGFNILSAKRYPLNAILIAGGTGVAPLLALAGQLKTYNLELITFLGARTKNHLLCEKDFKKLKAKVYTATEDGSKGYKGVVTDLLKQRLRTTNDERRTTIYACGPKPMLKEVWRLAKSKKIPCEVSLEENMACGTGACLGCAVETKDGYKMVCKDGPIFDAGDIVW